MAAAWSGRDRRPKSTGRATLTSTSSSTVAPKVRSRCRCGACDVTQTLSLEQTRRHFAEELRMVSHVGNERLLEAFATVPRERFAGPGPWRILHIGDGYWNT